MLSRPAIAQAMHALGTQFTPAVAQAMLAKETALMATVQSYGDTFLLATLVMACGIPAALLLPGMRARSRA